MTKGTSKMPFAIKLLVALQALLGVGAVFGGGALMVDPTGASIGMPSDIMKIPLFSSYFIPGMILLLVFGVVPLLVTSALIKKWEWSWGNKLNVFKELHWSWAFSLYIGFALIIWISVQIYILSSSSPVHLLYTAWGLAIQVLTILPSVSRYYTKP
ncbi:hypothetical protein [Paenibacillus senegalimassiliensis]|uniref:hypothetical protein n=1 Tax=Paenibacillus senegalimassiliensis TaxID=1737426 RepID=UPI000AA789AD|nr:hypothetical protein [Paenibacillus senegalimassiliensis]